MVAYVPPKQAGKYKAVASGAITNGKPVVVNSTGTVSSVSGSAASTGTAVIFESNSIGAAEATFDSENNKVIIYYSWASHPTYYSKVVVGTVSGTSISFGSPVQMAQRGFYESLTFDTNTNRVVIVYASVPNSNYGTAVVGAVSGTSISFGTPVVYESAYAENSQVTFDSNSNKIVVAYTDDGNSDHGTAIVGTVDSSDNSISFGSPVVFESAETQDIGITFDSNSNKIVIAYRDAGNSGYGTAIVGTVSGTSISFGTPVVYGSYTAQHNRPRFNSNDNTIVISHTNNGASRGAGIVGTVSGTSISFGTAATYGSATPSDPRATFDTSRNQLVVSHTADSKGKFAVGTVSGTSISFDTPTVFEEGTINTSGITFDSNSNKVVVGYMDGGDSNKGKAVVFSGSDLNITSENYIGIASGGTYVDTAEATIDVVGTVNKDQSGLTAGQTYYVQNDGTLGTSADDPSVVAGTAISATELIVKG